LISTLVADIPNLDNAFEEAPASPYYYYERRIFTPLPPNVVAKYKNRDLIVTCPPLVIFD
jgi:hypothetical protein